MGNQFDSKGGGQNIAQGENAIGKQVNNFLYRLLGRIFTSGNQSPAIGAGRDVAVNYGIPPALFAEYAGKLAVTEAALASFFKILEEQQVPLDDLDSKLREIAAQHKELLARLETVQSADSQVQRLKAEARQAIDTGEYTKAEQLLEAVARQYSLAAAETYAELARLQRIQLRYAKAAAYWQKAAALLPEESKQERSLYLHSAGYDMHRIGKYKEALPLFEQSLAIDRELGDKAGEGTTLNNIGQIYKARGDYATALKYLEQSLAIRKEIGDKAGEGTTLNNISGIHWRQGDYDTALKYLEQNLILFREIGDKAGKGTTLNNIGQIYDARGDYATALKYLEQSLAISQEIGDKAGEAVTSWNIGLTYEEHGDFAKAEQYISRAVQLAEEIDRPSREEWREVLEAVRAKLRGR